MAHDIPNGASGSLGDILPSQRELDLTTQPPAPLDVSIVIPTYRNERGIGALVERLKAFLEGRSGFEVVVVDDLSPDGTWSVLTGAIQGDARFRACRLARNVGQHRATRIGLMLARGKRVVTMDDDLQHPPEEIPTLLSAMRDDLDVVYGVYREYHNNAWRRFASWAATITLRATLGIDRRAKWQRPTSFRILSRRIVERIKRADSHDFMLYGWIHSHTSRIEYVLVRHEDRYIGRSSYTLRKLFALYLDLIFGYSVRPLGIVWTLGLVFSMLGLVLAAWVVVHAIASGGAASAGQALIASALFLGGVQLVATAVIGQYVGRTFLHGSLLQDDEGLIVERAADEASA
jgi:undecaprenyl-phosphate 4-deoxy-4-formamido-L-arabinose transferase